MVPRPTAIHAWFTPLTALCSDCVFAYSRALLTSGRDISPIQDVIMGRRYAKTDDLGPAVSRDRI